MSKRIFEFSMPEEREEFEIYCKAMDAHSALADLRNSIRMGTKCGDDTHYSWSEISDWFWQTIKDYELDI